MKKFTLQQNLFNEHSTVEISIPDDWNVTFYGLPGDDAQALSLQEIRNKLDSPIGGGGV